MTIKTSDLVLNVNGREVHAHLAEPEAGGPGILLLHAWWGLKPFFKELCDRLAEQGFLVLAPDLRNGQVADTIEAAKKLMEKSDNQAVGEAVLAARDALRAHPGLRGERIGVIGFSMGAAWALIVASRDPDQVAATVLYYGLGETQFGRIRSKVQGHFSDVDEWEPMDGVRWMEKELKTAGVETTFHIYPGRAHWFVEEDRPEYDAEAAALAWSRTVAFLRANLG